MVADLCQIVNIVENLGGVFTLKQIHGLEHVAGVDMENTAGVEVAVDVLHLLEGQRAGVDGGNGARADAIDRLAEELACLQYFTERRLLVHRATTQRAQPAPYFEVQLGIILVCQPIDGLRP